MSRISKNKNQYSKSVYPDQANAAICCQNLGKRKNPPSKSVYRYLTREITAFRQLRVEYTAVQWRIHKFKKGGRGYFRKARDPDIYIRGLSKKFVDMSNF
jgi:hypothetical protein